MLAFVGKCLSSVDVVAMIAHPFGVVFHIRMGTSRDFLAALDQRGLYSHLRRGRATAAALRLPQSKAIGRLVA